MLNMIKDKAQRKYYTTKKGKASRKRSSDKYYSTPKGYYNKYKKWAKKRNHNFELTLEVFESYWQNNCSYCGDKIDTIGLDRVDNNLGYTLENIVPCCYVCNRMKQELSFNNWINKMKKILKKVKSEKNIN